MSTPGRAILWQITWRSRWGLAAAAGWLLLAIVLVQVLPPGLNVRMGDAQLPAVGWYLGVSCAGVCLLLISVFGMSGNEASLAFTPHMFVLPIKTRTLVAWPMFTGCVTVTAVWLVTALLVFRPGGIAAPLWFPAAALSLYLAMFQALSWTPFAQRWLHMALAVVVFMTPPCLFLLGLLLLDSSVSDAAVAAGVYALVPLAWLAACSGVARARRGEPYDWRAWNCFLGWLATRRRAAKGVFSSPLRAQLWYECRAHYWSLPLFLGSTLLFVSFATFMQPHEVMLGWRLAAILLVAPVVVAMLLGGALGNLHDPLSKQSASAFVLTRPISTVALVRGKWIAAALATAATWLVVLAFLALLLLRPGFARSIAEVAGSLPPWKAVGIPILVLALLVLLTWKNMVENLWINLTGRAWVGGVYTWVGIVLVLAAIGAGLWIYFHPGLHAAAWAAVPWLIGVLVALKLCIAVSIVRGLDRCQLMGRPAIAAILAAWGLTAIAFSALALWLVPAGQASAWSLVSSVLLVVPFSRLAAAPLALEWNRHR
jgi:hypothetical protein